MCKKGSWQNDLAPSNYLGLAKNCLKQEEVKDATFWRNFKSQLETISNSKKQ